MPSDTSVLQGTFDTKLQWDLCKSIAKELGFDLDKGRLDVSVHPFIGGESSQNVIILVSEECMSTGPRCAWDCVSRSVGRCDMNLHPFTGSVALLEYLHLSE